MANNEGTRDLLELLLSNGVSFLIRNDDEQKQTNEDFEVVLISQDHHCFATMPWLALPFGNRPFVKLVQRYDLRVLPTLDILNHDLKMLIPSAVRFIERHGSSAVPHTQVVVEYAYNLTKGRLSCVEVKSA